MTQPTALISPRTRLLQRLKSLMTQRKTWTVMGPSIFCSGLLTGCGDNPIDASISSKGDRYGNEMAYLVVTAKVDDILIKGFTVNRGNCRSLEFAMHGNHLKFGQEYRALLSCNADQVKEAEVETSDGKYTFKF